MTIDQTELQSLTAKVVAAYVGNNSVPVQDLPTLINSVQVAFRNLGDDKPVPAKAELVPAVAIKKSVTPEYIVCLEDGKKLKMLKRHLKTVYDMTPDEYRAKWGLPPEYPMVAPNYAKARSEMATKLGLGRKRAAAE
ncbi:putative transcriptional regulator [Azospirillum lipoferum]|uniref:MucR family transcriptional regulator n=1 Tax=Azospirillum lipoferum TaxID=193 RepID=A0A5A9GWB4_AZOLI|nr:MULTISPECIES: MucR family transcriptional regulator [Azospirillum]KAA0598747.1 MucR family transcriptional regulator [Azospirillum lipoferum]MCP1609222.1 putative transcriptional regulator [Azospirillum lipoferum]MDW5535468.1 MucR family transcriptional regulator [Azospirillum sp. NL1]